MDDSRRRVSKMNMSLGAPGAEADSPAAGESMSSIDQAIDAVAREMTRVDAPDGMRADVLARIGNAAPRTGRALLPRWAMAAGLVVVLLAVATAVWFTRPAGQSESVVARQAQSPTLATGETRLEPQPATGLASARLASGAAGATRSGNGAGPAASGTAAAQPGETAAGEETEPGPAALAQPDPIFLTDLGPAALHIPDIGIAPIGELKPITIPDIPVGSGEPQSPSIHR